MDAASVAWQLRFTAHPYCVLPEEAAVRKELEPAMEAEAWKMFESRCREIQPTSD